MDTIKKYLNISIDDDKDRHVAIQFYFKDIFVARIDFLKKSFNEEYIPAALKFSGLHDYILLSKYDLASIAIDEMKKLRYVIDAKILPYIIDEA